MQQPRSKMCKPANENFKQCKFCGHKWGDLNDFLGDREIDLVGYQVNFDVLSAGLFLFNHSCGARLAMPVSPFNGLHGGQIFKNRATGSSECPDHCLYQDRLDTCPVECECAFVRDILYIIKSWPKY